MSKYLRIQIKKKKMCVQTITSFAGTHTSDFSFPIQKKTQDITLYS